MATFKPEDQWIHYGLNKAAINSIHFVKKIDKSKLVVFASWNAAEEGYIPCVLDKNMNLYISTNGEPYVYANENCSSMFALLNFVKVIDGLELLNTSKVENMENMFYGCGYFSNSLIISGMEIWNTSNVTTMKKMFNRAAYNANSFDIGNIGNWDTSNVKDMNAMFAQAGYGTIEWSIGDIGSWNVSNVKGMHFMFADAGINVKKNLNLSDWKAPSNIRTNFSKDRTIIEPTLQIQKKGILDYLKRATQ